MAAELGCAALRLKPCVAGPVSLRWSRKSQDHSLDGARMTSPQRNKSTERRKQARGGVTEPSRPQLVTMVIGTFREMPGLSLHLNQAARLFGVRAETCRILLDDLVAQGRLRRAHDGQYLVQQSGPPSGGVQADGRLSGAETLTTPNLQLPTPNGSRPNNDRHSLGVGSWSPVRRCLPDSQGASVEQ